MAHFERRRQLLRLSQNPNFLSHSLITGRSSHPYSGVMATLTAERPLPGPGPGPAKRLNTWTMTREALTIGFDAGDGFLGRPSVRRRTPRLIGQSFALLEMVLIAAVLSQRTVFDLAPNHPVELEATLTLRPKHGLHLIGSRR